MGGRWSCGVVRPRRPPVRPPGPQGLEPWTEPVAADRLLLFSDAVFAISATLLVLDIRIAPGLGSTQLSQASLMQPVP